MGRHPTVPDPGLDVTGVEVHVTADLQERDTALVNQPTDEAIADAQALRKSLHVEEVLSRGCAHA